MRNSKNVIKLCISLNKVYQYLACGVPDEDLLAMIYSALLDYSRRALKNECSRKNSRN